VIRNRSSSILTGILGLGVTIGFTAVGIAASPLAPDQRALPLLIGLLYGPLLLRAAVAGVRATGSGLRVRNVLRTRQHPWGEVSAFSIGRWGLFPNMGFVHFTDGGREHLFGIQGPNPSFHPRDRTTEKLLDELMQSIPPEHRKTIVRADRPESSSADEAAKRPLS
jgi:hypothetical protein